MYHKMNFTNLCLGYRLKLNLVAYKGKSKQKQKTKNMEQGLSFQVT